MLESQYYEDIYKKQYAEDGYQLLNVAATGINTGSTGGIAKWTSKEKVFEESKKYHTRSEFQRKAGGAYNHAKHNKWLDEMTWLKAPERNIKWTYEAVIEESHKYEYKCDFRKNAGGAYQTASENGWLKEMVWLKDKRSLIIIGQRKEYLRKVTNIQTKRNSKIKPKVPILRRWLMAGFQKWCG